jgi:methionyl-tRNA formyltransferase
MRIFFLGNNRVACECLEWLTERGEEVIGIAVHPPERRKYGDRLLAAAQLDSDRIFDGSRLRDGEVLEAIQTLKPDIALSVLFDYILASEFIDLFYAGVVNLHPSLLPYNRGQYPNVWSIVEDTPSGVTLHYIDSGVDTGDIIAQREVPVAPTDTGEALYRRLESTSVELFRDTWPQIRSGTAERRPQPIGAGTYHRKRDVERIDLIDLDSEYRARNLIDILRARTFPPYPGAYFMDGDRKIYIRLQLLTEEDLASGDDVHFD